ncbi:hypothetical protein DP939_43600 [Spongiactinospora rosea]|uniref:OmpR/PhoB-type domain-containing protein n=1 Tax=Spongiactinospora rosea TaxID=2248750 RepID=A0A366LJI2_9ACTN|nr:BTAD domain-containing putative transcriptional regulator [Spongiactinospora rosea]RBQ13900.1 hypothetical protein DP939_43600 [Spongiactinospora rosea]
MWFRYLGRVEFRTDINWYPIPGPRPRALLALLMLDAGRVVSVDRLVLELWPRRPPASAAVLIRNYVLQCRRALGDREGKVIATCPGGYELRCPPESIDGVQFETQTTQGLAALDRGEGEEAERRLSAALSLWDGEPFMDAAPTPSLTAMAHRFTELRQLAAEGHVEARLLLGRHTDIVVELRTLLAQHPLRERLWGQLMRALHAAGRRAEALDAYREARSVLTEELGLEPCGELQALHQAILTDDGSGDAAPRTQAAVEPAEDPDPASAPPNEIFRGSGVFAGRQADVNRLEHLLLDPEGPGIVVIDGVGGVGKSELATHLAHRISPHFPDGLFYVDLQGSSRCLKPLEPVDVLGRMLRSLGVPTHAVPPEEAEAAARFRSLTANRRMLLLLDNAVDSAQIRPLMPAKSCSVLVTSRRTLPVLGGAVHHLQPMSEEESLALLASVVSAERIAAEREQALRIARLCGGLPLALTIAAARLASRPAWPLRFLADKLMSKHHRLDELKVDDLEVRTSFATSRQELDNDPRSEELVKVFRHMGLPHWPEITVPVAAALTGLPQRRSEEGLEGLLDARLVDSPRPHHYLMHDLVRLFATEEARSHLSDRERHEALLRAFQYYHAAALQVTELLDPLNLRWLHEDERRAHAAAEVYTAADALAWLDDHRRNLVPVVRQAATTPGSHETLAVQLAAALTGPLRIRGYLQDCCALNQIILPATARRESIHAEARTHLVLSHCHGLGDQDTERALGHIARAQALYRAAEDTTGEARALLEWGTLLAREERYDDAADRLLRSITILRSVGEPYDEVLALHRLGLLEERIGDTPSAMDNYRQGACLSQDLGYRHGEYYHLASLARAHYRNGDHDQAVRRYEQALVLAREVGDRHGEAGLLWDLGRLFHELARADRARTYRHQALDVMAGMGTLSLTHPEAPPISSNAAS